MIGAVGRVFAEYDRIVSYILLKVDSVGWLHALAKILHVRFFVRCALELVPIVRCLPGGKYKYRVKSLDSILLVDEIFHSNTYREAITQDVRTIADVGCNVGYFPILVAQTVNPSNLAGLMVDANPEMVEEARRNIQSNHLDNLHILHGIIGAAGDSFYLHPSDLASSQFTIDEPGKSWRGEWKEIKAPRTELEREWRVRFGDARCNLLKVDIEGSEGRLFQQERTFLARTDQIVLEWHKWVITLPEIEQILNPLGFMIKKIIREEENKGIVWFTRN
jgi:FkbM family methyltransferase